MPEGTEPIARVAPKDVQAAATPGVGSVTKIEFPPDIVALCHSAGAFYAVEGEGGAEPREERNTPPSVMLGHELIHADHARRGTFVPTLHENKRVHAYAGPEENVDEEELRTVGIGEPRLTPMDITENELRTQLKLPARVSYRPHARNVGDRAAKEREVRRQDAQAALVTAIKAYNGNGRQLGLPGVGIPSTGGVPGLRASVDKALATITEWSPDVPAAAGLAGPLQAALQATVEFAND